MKHIPPIIAILLVVIGCSLSERFKKSANSNPPKGTITTADGEPVEKPSPTAAQIAAIANGQTAKWDQQGITWTLPANWKKQNVSTEMFNYGGDGAFLIVNISSMASSFPTDISLKAMHEGAKVNEKNGKNDELKWLELDGLRGVEFRESKPEMADDIRRLEWQAYRTYSGQTQLVTMILSSRGENFTKHQDELYGILYSTKLVH
jgi:hypothetical protein